MVILYHPRFLLPSLPTYNPPSSSQIQAADVCVALKLAETPFLEIIHVLLLPDPLLSSVFTFLDFSRALDTDDDHIHPGNMPFLNAPSMPFALMALNPI